MKIPREALNIALVFGVVVLAAFLLPFFGWLFSTSWTPYWQDFGYLVFGYLVGIFVWCIIVLAIYHSPTLKKVYEKITEKTFED